jgi:hypothetical protein
MAYSRQWVADMLRRFGYTEAADAALRELPEEPDLEELTAFGDRHGVSRGELMNRMSGSP